MLAAEASSVFFAQHAGLSLAAIFLLAMTARSPVVDQVDLELKHERAVMEVSVLLLNSQVGLAARE